MIQVCIDIFASGLIFLSSRIAEFQDILSEPKIMLQKLCEFCFNGKWCFFAFEGSKFLLL